VRKMMIAVPIAALVLVAAGCGSSSTSSTDTTASVGTNGGTDTNVSTDASVSTDATSTDETTDTGSTDTTGGADTGTTDTTSSASGASASVSGCTNLAALSSKFAQALAASSNSAGNTDLEATAKAYKAFAEQVPEEIRGAFRTVADAFARYAEVFKGLDLQSGKTPDAATLAKLAGAAKSLNNAKLATANAQITAWAQKNCKSG
jgi:hypothetical protein